MPGSGLGLGRIPRRARDQHQQYVQPHFGWPAVTLAVKCCAVLHRECVRCVRCVREAGLGCNRRHATEYGCLRKVHSTASSGRNKVEKLTVLFPLLPLCFPSTLICFSSSVSLSFSLVLFMLLLPCHPPSPHTCISDRFLYQSRHLSHLPCNHPPFARCRFSYRDLDLDLLSVCCPACL